jgi:hypothetical protein
VIDSVNEVRRHFAPPPSPGAGIQELGDALVVGSAAPVLGRDRLPRLLADGLDPA